MMKLLAAAVALTLAACGSTHIAKPSDLYLTCAAEPDVPDGAGPAGEIIDEQNALYLQSLRGAGQDCRSKLEYVRDWVHKLPD